MTTAYRVWVALGRGRDPTPNVDRGKYLVGAWDRARRMGYTADEFAALPRWVAESDHTTAAFLRERRLDGNAGYVFRYDHLDERLTEVRGWLAGQEQGPAAKAGPLVNGTAAAWALVTGWVAECHVGKRSGLPTDTPEAIRIVTAFSAAGGRRRYERERNVEPMMIDFARHLGHA